MSLRWLLPFSILVILMCCASVKSKTGNIIIDIDSDGNSDVMINTTGLAIGDNLTPSSNLHVSGNIMATHSITIGDNVAGTSTLNIGGSLGVHALTITSNVTLSEKGLNLIDSSSGDINLTLPDAVAASGRIYTVKKISTENNCTLSGGGNLIDLSPQYYFASGNTGYLSVISDGAQWYVINKSAEGVSGGTGWVPSDISILLWLDASDASTITLTSGAVSQWDDKSGNNNHATQGSSSKRPLYAANEVDFDGSDDEMNISNDPFKNVQNPCIIAVYHKDADVHWGATVASWNGEGTNGFKLRQPTSSVANLTFTVRNTSGADDQSTGALVTLNQNFLAAAYRKNNNTRILKYNGNQEFSISDTGSIGYSSGSSKIGGTPYLNGSLVEVVVANGLTDEEIEMLEGYMAHRWGLGGSLPSSHPYKSAPP